jgi:serine/arginine repetitive matrix protein 2
MNSPAHALTPKSAASPTTTTQPVFVVDSDTGSTDVTISGPSFWNAEMGAVALTKYYALRSEVEETVVESKKKWADTPFSIFAVQSES